ncbi:hypothetical protein ACWYXO_17890 [Janthinobacterium aestuarii]
MGYLTRPSAARLKQIHNRQDNPGWGKDYVPAIKATREEAPSGSRPALTYSGKLQRDVHTLSKVETETLLIGLYCPKVFDLHEERMLAYLPCTHPLAVHPRTRHLSWPNSRGTLAAAEELSALRCHPTIKVADPEFDGELMEIPFPLIGDFLWFLEDKDGCYCVNWTIKGSREDFAIKSHFNSPVIPTTKAASAAWKASMRHGVEEIYYSDFGIRTQRISRDDYSRDLANNLSQIFGWIYRPVTLPMAAQKKILNWLRLALSSGIPPFQMWSELASTEQLYLDDVKYVMYRSIWERQLKVDLFQPIHIDWPLLPEKRDVLDVYAEWFRR